MPEIAFTEELAQAIQGDLEHILTTLPTLATKEDIKQIRQEMATKEELRLAVADIKATMATKEDLLKLPKLEEIREIVTNANQAVLKEVDGLRVRMNRVENHLGLN